MNTRFGPLSAWVGEIGSRAPIPVISPRPSDLAKAHDEDLWRYFDLCALARNLSTPRSIRSKAEALLFTARIGIERNIRTSIRLLSQQLAEEDFWKLILHQPIYGRSNKQGISIRFALYTCDATTLCRGKCYAHDVLDASKNAVIRGVTNSFIAEEFEKKPSLRPILMRLIERHTKRAVKAALSQRWISKNGELSPAYIRFSHVGEMPAFPKFSNALARQVVQISEQQVTPVIYTRHKNARDLDKDLFVINFTLDASSLDRISWMPNQARLVFSAFEGALSASAEVNFLEHHRWEHYSPVGEGHICPATSPATVERTCEDTGCSTCFRKTNL